MPAWSLAAPEWVYRFRRVRRLELMDDPSVGAADRQAALEGLRRIGGWWGQRLPLADAIAGLLGKPRARRLRLIEVGAGGGDGAAWLQAWLGQRGYWAEVLATDLYPNARQKVKRLDALAPRLPEADLYFSNLFLHHLPDEALPKLFARQAKASRLGFAHFDLQRHWAHFYGALVATRIAGLAPINFTDGLRSIQQGYTRRELQALADQGLSGCHLRWSAPFRWLLTWKRP